MTHARSIPCIDITDFVWFWVRFNYKLFAIASKTYLTFPNNPTGALQKCFPLIVSPQAANRKRVTVRFPCYDQLEFARIWERVNQEWSCDCIETCLIHRNNATVPLQLGFSLIISADADNRKRFTVSLPSYDLLNFARFQRARLPEIKLRLYRIPLLLIAATLLVACS